MNIFNGSYSSISNPATEFNGVFADLYAPSAAPQLAIAPLQNHFPTLYGAPAAAAPATAAPTAITPPTAASVPTSGGPAAAAAIPENVMTMFKDDPSRTDALVADYPKLSAAKKKAVNDLANKFVTMDDKGKQDLRNFFEFMKKATPQDKKNWENFVKAEQAKEPTENSSEGGGDEEAPAAKNPSVSAQQEQALNQQYVNLITSGGSVNWVQ